MSRLRYNRRQAVEHLRDNCPEMGRFVSDCGPLKLKTAADPDLFSALARAIVYQQLSGKAPEKDRVFSPRIFLPCWL